MKNLSKNEKANVLPTKRRKMDFKVTIKEFCKALEDDAQAIQDLVRQQTHCPNAKDISLNAFNSMITFMPKDEKEDFSQLKNKSGVYVFKMSEDCSIDDNFDEVKYGAKRLKKFKSLKSFSKNEILYIGKCMDLFTRMREHLDNNEVNRVGSLKLTSLPRKNLIGKFTIYLFCLNDEFISYYNLIATRVERKLRDILIPCVGQ